MKKHILGLLLFGFIVGAAAIVYSVFYVEKMEISKTPFVPEGIIACEKNGLFESSASQPKVKQAVFNVKTKTLSWEFPASKSNKYSTLYLFLKDEKGTRYLDSLRSENCLRGDESVNFIKKYPSLSGISSKTNLYLISDSKEYSDELNHSIEFDADKAIPVTIDYGK